MEQLVLELSSSSSGSGSGSGSGGELGRELGVELGRVGECLTSHCADVDHTVRLLRLDGCRGFVLVDLRDEAALTPRRELPP